MDTLTVFAIYLATGAISGLASGLFGIGGGLVMVPALLACFAQSGVAPESIPALALGTSLTSIAFTSFVASREHLRLGNLSKPWSASMAWLVAFLCAGVFAGSALATTLPRAAILACIGAFQLAVAAWMLRASFLPKPASGESSAPAPAHESIPAWRSRLFMALTGSVSAIGGIGGATLMIPYFSSQGVDYRRAAALSTFLGCSIGLFGFASYAFFAHPSSPIPMSLGFVSLPAFASMAFGSFFLVKAGARLSRRISPKILTRGFCVFLSASAAKMLLPLAPMLA